MKKTFKLFALAALGLFVSFAMSAQVTTSSMSGKIVDEQGSVVGAAIIATHTPSGTQYYAVSNSEGRYAIQGMRPGGPYDVKIQMMGCETVVYQGVTLNLGEVYVQNATLKAAATALDEVVVVASASKFATEKTGASTSINSADMQKMPTVNRSISDLARVSPYANGMSFAGGDGRSTNFTVDGSNFNNNFGLSDKLPGGGSPISVDALEEIQVVIAPYDVRQTNFIGGGINAITKSGTNTFKGSVYGYYRNQAFRGNTVAGVDCGDRKAESHRVLGATIGGPIIKDKLFFFANFEHESNPGQVIKYRANKGGEAYNNTGVSRCTADDLAAVQAYMKSKYNYDTGSYTDFPGDESNMKILARLDWNVNRDHRISLRYNYTKNTAWNGPNGNSSDTGYRLNGTYRVGDESMAFANNMYSQDNKVQTLSLDYNSRLSDNLSEQLLVTYTKIDDVRGSKSSPFPHVDIIKKDGAEWQPYMSLGYELFTWNNGVHNNVLTIKDDLIYTLGAHKITAGVNYEYQFANNAYMRNGALYYRYAWTTESTIEQVLDGTPESFAITYGWDGNLNPNAQVTFHQIGAYLQDEWAVNDNLKLTGGVRLDTILFDESDIATNKAIYAYDFKAPDGTAVKIDTGKWPTTKIQVNPRLGFVYDVFGDKSLKVRGGTGIFQGRLPLVYFTNMPTNAGMVQNSVQYKSTWTSGELTAINHAQLDQFSKTGTFGGMITSAQEAIEKLGLQTSLTDDKHVAGNTMSGVDPKFKMPQDWKTSLAVDYQLPVDFPFTVTLEAMYHKTINGVNVYNVNIDPDTSTWGHFSGADNRLIYPANKGAINAGKNAPYLVNTNKGYGYTGNITINTTPVKNLDIMAAYTITESKEVSGLPGSDPLSTWQGMITVDGPNFGTAQRSQYVIPHKAIASISYTIPYTGTHLNVFYTGYAPYSNSFCYSNDMNGDGINNDLMYIPKDDTEISFTNPADAAAFWAFVDQDKYLKSHKGQYAEAYAARAPWSNRFDFRLAQDISFKAAGQKHTFQILFDLMNVGNLFNSKWGIWKSNSASNNCRILKYDGKDASGVPQFSMNKKDGNYLTTTYEYPGKTAYTQCWNFQIGLRYLFN
ncbi:MAG: TonB-dependent receptor [Bacteroidales bacterium]|nr:TonB-dependent receptor [Bacteroidales bacterium]